jgi:hypothetical protein
MCAANQRRRARGRPRRTQSASAGSALGLVGVVVGRRTTGIAGGRSHRWTPCAGTEVRRLGPRRRTRILGRDTSHFVRAGSGARVVTLVDEGMEFEISAGTEQRAGRG